MRRAYNKRAGQFCPRYRQWLGAKKPSPSLYIEALPAESFRKYWQKVVSRNERAAGDSKDYGRGWRAGYITGALVAVGWAVAAFYVLPLL